MYTNKTLALRYKTTCLQTGRRQCGRGNRIITNALLYCHRLVPLICLFVPRTASFAPLEICNLFRNVESPRRPSCCSRGLRVSFSILSWISINTHTGANVICMYAWNANLSKCIHFMMNNVLRWWLPKRVYICRRDDMLMIDGHNSTASTQRACKHEQLANLHTAQSHGR
jgi:hypothetical protein